MRTKGDKLYDLKALKFCAEYVACGDAKAAAIAAGYSESTAHVKTHQWLRDRRYLDEIARMSDLVRNEVDLMLTDHGPAEKPAKKPKTRNRKDNGNQSGNNQSQKPETVAEDADADAEVPPLPEEEEKRSAYDETLRNRARAAAQAAKELGINKLWVIGELVANHYRAIDGEKPNLAASNKALELIGTELQMFVKREHLTFDTLQDLSPEQAAQELGKAFADAAHLSPDLVGLLAQFSGTRQ